MDSYFSSTSPAKTILSNLSVNTSVVSLDKIGASIIHTKKEEYVGSLTSEIQLSWYNNFSCIGVQLKWFIWKNFRLEIQCLVTATGLLFSIE